MDSVATDGNGNVRWLIVRGARHNNLKNIDVALPLGRFICITGVSGSGKSSLVVDILQQRLARDLNGAENVAPGEHDRIEGLEHLDKVIDIDQKPIGRTPRSNPATYVKVFDEIRNLYAKLPDSKVRGYKPGRFSFNVATGATGGGRCEACEGNGANCMDMEFLADVWVTCPVCNGHRYSHETLQVHFHGKSIADVLEMDVQQALEHFENIPKVRAMLQTLHDVGLDYVKLGQSATTLSGGEAQRIKLARELVRKSTGRTLYILDEPTTGLHFEDIRKLLEVLHGFVEAGNTVVVIEHNLDVLKTADWIIDLGPEGGDEGGNIVIAGTPEQVADCERSYTGQALRDVLWPTQHIVPAQRKKPRTKTGGPLSSAIHEGQLTDVSVVGARQHNLKDITVRFPRDRITVCSGVSGSGKSSFAMDTVYAEGQRRYVESLSAYARQFLGQVAKPLVERVEGLSPAISIEQKTTSRSPRSTVGTVTEIYDYMRVLWSRIGTPYCPRCGIAIGTQSSDEIIERVMTLPEGTRVLVLAPLERSGNEDYAELFAREKNSGFARVRVDGTVYELSNPPQLDRRSRHHVEMVVDRLIIRSSQRSRIADSIELALSIGNGWMTLSPVADEDRTASADQPRQNRLNGDLRFSQHRSCTQCGNSYEELTPHHFSFNTRLGWCPVCEGLGTQQGASSSLIVSNPHQSIREGAITGWEKIGRNPLLVQLLEQLADFLGFSLDTPWIKLPAAVQNSILYGTGVQWIEAKAANAAGWKDLRFQWKGFYPAIDEATKSSWQYRTQLGNLTTEIPCQHCGGSRLRHDAGAVRVIDKTIVEVCQLPLNECLAFFKQLKLDARQRKVAGELLVEIRNRLTFLVDVGLEYVTLNRAAPTLSGGESQRIRLASQIGSGLTGVLYVLDEPTIGLHPRDTNRLLKALHHLRDLGNTLLMVEHDREVMCAADHILDFGPGAGTDGGRIVAAGAPGEVEKNADSLTGKYLAGSETIAIPTERRQGNGLLLEVIGASHHNLRQIDAAFPLGCFIAVTGVSGSGKSSLVNDVLYAALAKRIHRASIEPGAHLEIRGVEHIDKVINVDQSPLGNSPSSNPATYTGIFDLIRELYAKLPDAKVRGYNTNRFSFNRPGGRCEACEGNGQRCIEMHFLPDVWITCEECNGTRYKSETLEVKYKGKSIADVLEMRVSEALQHFANVPKIRRMLQTLEDVGLGYVALGQPAPTLSGGEAQRVKLAAELGRPSTGKTLYILDEPTTGLHFDDLRKLLLVLHRFCDLGNTVICIEHNLDVIKTADWLIDLGPEGGIDGGDIVAEGPPERVVAHPQSHTGRILASVLKHDPHQQREVFEPTRKEETQDQRLVVDEESDARLPWEVDGKRWHTRDRVSRKGEKIRWEGAALEWIVEQIEKAGKGKFAATNYNDRARVEIKVTGNNIPWFFHARTGGAWLLDCNFRVPTRSFSAAEVRRMVPLRILDDCDELPIYGRDPRVNVRHSSQFTDDIRILVHNKKEIATPGTAEFIQKAVQAYFRFIRKMASDIEAHQPWKVNGRSWHLSQSVLSPKKPKLWRGSLILEVLGRMKKIDPQIQENWNRKVVIPLSHPDIDGSWGWMVTNHANALGIGVLAKLGTFTPTLIEKLGFDSVIRRVEARPHQEEVMFWLQRIEQCDAGQFDHLIRESIASLTSSEKQGTLWPPNDE